MVSGTSSAAAIIIELYATAVNYFITVIIPNYVALSATKKLVNIHYKKIFELLQHILLKNNMFS